APTLQFVAEPVREKGRTAVAVPNDRLFRKDICRVPNFYTLGDPIKPVVTIKRERMTLAQYGPKTGAFHRTKRIPDPQGHAIYHPSPSVRALHALQMRLPRASQSGEVCRPSRRCSRTIGMAAREAANIGVLKGLTEIYAHVSAGRRREFAALIVLMALGAFAELVTIGSVIPFLSLLSGQASGSLPSLASAFS